MSYDDRPAEGDPGAPSTAPSRRLRQTAPDSLSEEFGHLPKLESAGFVVWGPQDHSVRKGPRFEEIEPLLELLQNHADELPDDWL